MSPRPVLAANDLAVGYGGVPVVTDLNLSLERGEVLALIGANGAGKTTALLGLAGALPALAGSALFNSMNQSAGLARNARRGMALITDDRSIFKSLTVIENLRLGRTNPERALELFPTLEALRHRKAGLLSGGEQQMLSLARAMSAEPALLLVDELSLGLAPVIVAPLLASIRNLADRCGSAVILVEQHVQAALRVADRALVLQRGRTVFDGPADTLAQDQDRLERAYLSGAP